jgi:RNA polymerase-binding protein DksA
MPGRAAKKATARRTTGAARPSPRHVAAPAKRAAKPAAKKTVKKPAKPAAKKKTTAKKAAPRATKPAPAKKKTAATKPAGKKAPAKAARPAAKKAAAPRPAAKKTVKAAAPAPAKAAAGPRAAAPAGAKAKPAAVAVARPSILEGRTKHGKNTVLCPLSGFEVTPSPANLGAKTLDRLRQKLIDEKQRLLHQADDLTAEAEQLAREREAGDTQFDEESGEGDTVNVERERDLLLSATARQVVEEIDDAVERIKRNKYGVCKPAGRKIALERLEAIPWAQVCVDCKARAERRR